MVIYSCEIKSSDTCEREKQYYHEVWDYEVLSAYRYKKYKATYVIKTTSGKTIFFSPIQDMVFYAEPGDRVVKKEYDQFGYLIDKNGDSLRSRIFSPGCDSLVGVREKRGQRW